MATLLAYEQPRSLREILSSMAHFYPPSYEAARVQFDRDKKDLRDEGVEVHMTGTGEDARYRIDPSTYYLPDLDLTDDEAVALNLAASRVRLDGHDPDEALLKLGQFGVEGQAIVGLPSDARLPLIYAALRARAPLTLAYNGVERVVEAYGLLCRDGFWYVAGNDLTRPGRKNYRVDRIEGPVVAGAAGSYEVPPDFVLSESMAEEPYELSPGTAIDVDVWLDAVMAPRSAGEVVSRGEDGSVVVRLSVTNVSGLRSWLFGLRDHARVVGPQSVVDEVVGWLREMA